MTKTVASPETAVGERLLAEIDSFADGVVDRLRAHLPSYAAVPLAEHQELVRTQMRQIVTGLLAHKEPAAEDLAGARELGWRRAAQGVPLPEVIEAYHSCYREIWLALVEETTEDPDLTRALVADAATLWSWTHQLSANVAIGHTEALQTRFAERAELRRKLFNSLTDGRADDPDTARLAAVLELDPSGSFQAICTSDVGGRSPDELQHELDRKTHSAICGARGGTATILIQGSPPGPILQALDLQDAAVGVGICRAGLTGALASIGDAESALRLAEWRGGAVEYESAWLLCTMFHQREGLREPLAVGREVAAEHPHLAATVRAFAENGFRVADCARQMHLHPNSAKYRLDRWQQLTGWDVQTFDGLITSHAAIELFDNTSGSAGGAA
jgi:hypothetical protein